MSSENSSLLLTYYHKCRLPTTYLPTRPLAVWETPPAWTVSQVNSKFVPTLPTAPTLTDMVTEPTLTTMSIQPTLPVMPTEETLPTMSIQPTLAYMPTQPTLPAMPFDEPTRPRQSVPNSWS